MIELLDPTRRMSRAGTAASATLVAALLTGCSGDDGRLEVQVRAGTVALVESHTDGGMEAYISGRLARGPGGCLVLQAGDRIDLVVWPEGSDLHDDGRAVDVARIGFGLGDQGTVRVGEDFAGGGGFVDPVSHGYPVPERCGPVPDEIVVVSSLSRR